MIHLTHKPAPPLDQFVECLWYWAGPPPAHRFERLMPDGCVEIVINLAADRIVNYDRHDQSRTESVPGAVVAGAHSRFFVIDTERTALIGVHCKPGGAFPFLRVPVGETHNREIALEALWGRAAAARLREQLLAAPTPAAKFAALERGLLAAGAGRFEGHPAVRWALGELARPASGVTAVADALGLSARRFIEVFRAEVGLTPKRYCRVRRFQQAISGIGRRCPVDWAALALDCGYYDQAHFAHDFKEFSGITPAAYVAARGDSPNHVRLPG